MLVNERGRYQSGAHAAVGEKAHHGVLVRIHETDGNEHGIEND